MEFKMGELFCGPGGIGLGATQASESMKSQSWSISHIWANDLDEDSCETYRLNICPDTPEVVICGDVANLNFNELEAIDALAFGFPCNDFSLIGEQKGLNGDYGPLYAYGVKALRHFRPQWFIAENVGGLRSANDGRAFRKILSELKSAGYNITPHLYRFEGYSVPQTRHRIVIVGIRSDIDVQFKVPKPSPDRITCRIAIENPPIPADAHNNEQTRQSQRVIERLTHIGQGENAFIDSLPDHLKLNLKGATFSQIYKRLEADKPAYTVTGSGGGGTHVYHWEENRALTNRERARLQTFPDKFVFCGAKESVRRQIGMALPPTGAAAIFEAILKSFARVDYPSIDANISHEGANVKASSR